MPAPLHRYWLFTGFVYSPCGGAHDLLATYPTLEEARAAATAWEAEVDIAPYSWWHVLDQTTGQILAARPAQGSGVSWLPGAPALGGGDAPKDRKPDA
jgi:hypothetical protein